MKFFILIITFSLFADFDSNWTRIGDLPIKRFKVCGERCSGTNYLTVLLEANFTNFNRAGLQEFGQKHFFWWNGIAADFEKLKKLKYGKEAIDYSGSDDCLFLFCVRDPFDWIRSFYLQPFHVHYTLARFGFVNFFTSPWVLESRYMSSEGQFNEIDNLNPYTGKPFANVFEMRSYKYKNFLKLSDIVKNFFIVRYEDLEADPEGFLKFLSEKFKLQRKETYSPILTYKQEKGIYIKKKYFKIEPYDLNLLTMLIDWETERLVGYLKEKSLQKYYDEL